MNDISNLGPVSVLVVNDEQGEAAVVPLRPLSLERLCLVLRLICLRTHHLDFIVSSGFLVAIRWSVLPVKDS